MYDNKTLWLKAVWIPIWVVVLGSAIVGFVDAGIEIYYSSQLLGDEPQYEATGYPAYMADSLRWTARGERNGAIVLIIFSLTTLLFNIAEAVLLTRRKLVPVVAVVGNAVCLGIWTILLICFFFSRTLNYGGAVELIATALLLASSLAAMIYSSVILNRARSLKGDLDIYNPKLATPQSSSTILVPPSYEMSVRAGKE